MRNHRRLDQGLREGRPDAVAAELSISKLTELPQDLDELAQASLTEGFRFVARLRDEWASGANRFALPGEALLQARHQGRLVGICGLNREPHAGDASVGRVRRLCVVSDARRSGVPRRLVGAVLGLAHGNFAILQLRTTNREAGLFYQALGFRRTTSIPTATHEIRLSFGEPTV